MRSPCAIARRIIEDRECSVEEIIEIDSYSDLKERDEPYC